MKDGRIVTGRSDGIINIYKDINSNEIDQEIYLYVEGGIESIIVLQNNFIVSATDQNKIRSIIMYWFLHLN